MTKAGLICTDVGPCGGQGCGCGRAVMGGSRQKYTAAKKRGGVTVLSSSRLQVAEDDMASGLCLISLMMMMMMPWVLQGSTAAV